VLIAIAQDHLKHTADAVDYLEQSLRLAKERGNVPIQRYALHRLGLLEQQQGHAQNSRVYLERALTLSEHTQDEAEQARVLYSLGVLAADQSRTDEARERFDKAASIAERLKLPELAQIRQARDSVRSP